MSKRDSIERTHVSKPFTTNPIGFSPRDALSRAETRGTAISGCHSQFDSFSIIFNIHWEPDIFFEALSEIDV